LIENLDVIARTKPEHKYALVTGLKQVGKVVACTGKSADDARALRKADMGFAMGNEGTDLAKENAGIMILDDNFCSIVNAVVWGRNIYENIRRFIQF
jgi:Ca2+ transporting ATPase